VRTPLKNLYKTDMSTAGSIDWDSALGQVRGDEAFLKEILQDFIKESADSLERILEGMRTRKFNAVMKAAHQIKGSASYLYCDDIMTCATQLQSLGNEGDSCDEAEKPRVWISIEAEYNNLGVYIGFLNQAIGIRWPVA
jgi:HPt (histidine-containing phosphotransfer) domain-containing protein